MNKIPNRKAICDTLMEAAKEDRDIVVLCSDSRGSASLTPFADAYPDQFVEMGIAEQNLVSVSAGLAKCGKKPFAASPACFLSTRSYEQIKVDAAYSNTNVKLIGISGGISYGALGMSHHSAQDIAALSAIPNMRVYLPSDRFQTACLVKALLKDDKPAYIRVGRNAVEDIYEEANVPFVMDKATVLSRGSDGEACVGRREAPWEIRNQRRRDGYVLREAPGRGSGQRGCLGRQAGGDRGRTRSLRRAGFQGKPGGIRMLSQDGGKSQSSGRTCNHRHIGPGV